MVKIPASATQALCAYRYPGVLASQGKVTPRALNHSLPNPFHPCLRRLLGRQVCHPWFIESLTTVLIESRLTQFF